MRILRFEDGDGQTRLGIDQGDGTAQALEGELFARPRPTGRTVAVRRPLAPLEPANIFCIGLNYRDHAAESGSSLPDNPLVFMKPTTALNHPDAPIRLPACAHGPEVDYEGELAVVLGRPARDVPVADALDYVLGYTVGHDVSARWWQKIGSGGQFVRGKGFDSFCPLGPVLVTADEIPDPQKLRITTRLNGQVMQDGSTADMIFSVADLIAFLSQDTTLLPGTVILTGTPAGVGSARDPKVFLKAGDRVEIEIEGIGVLANPVEDVGGAG